MWFMEKTRKDQRAKDPGIRTMGGKGKEWMNFAA